MKVDMSVVLSIVLVLVVIILIPVLLYLYFYVFDRNQKQHSVLRNYPVLGKIRFILEMVGPEFRQYLFDHDNQGKPFSRIDFLNIVLPAKYLKNIISFGSKRDFDQPGFYIKNAMFPKQVDELAVNNKTSVFTRIYKIDEEGLVKRKEHSEAHSAKPWLLPDEHAVVIGENCPNPFVVKGLIGMSAMSYGGLGDHALTALSQGLGYAGGTWMNTGEGGLSSYHLKGDVDLIMQIGPGMFGVRTKDGEFSWDELKKKSEIKQLKAFEIKLGQGAKVRGGHLEGSKVTEEIAEIRGVEPFKTIDSPNRFKQFNDVPSLIDFVEKIREHSGKPVGIKIVIGGEDSVEELAAYMKETGKGPDFISVDGGEGGTGATYQELADGVGLPIQSAIIILDETLRKYEVRDRVKIIAAGKLFTPDKVAVAMAMGADLVNIARGFMITVGCIGAQKCHTNECPVGVATTDPRFQKALVIEEKQYRVTNYVLAMREGLYHLAAAAGLESPVQFERKHIVYKDERGRVTSLEQAMKKDTDSNILDQINYSYQKTS